MRKFKRRASCLPRPTTLLSSPLRLWTRCERERKNDMEPFFATREVKKFWLEGGLLCLYECVFDVLQLRKIPKRASSVFPSNLSCQELRPEGKTDRCFFCLSPVCFVFLHLLTKNVLETRGKKKTMRERESHVSVQKDGVNGVFYCLVFLLFLLRAYHGWGHFDWCFFFTSRLVLPILLCLSICLFLRADRLVSLL